MVEIEKATQRQISFNWITLTTSVIALIASIIVFFREMKLGNYWCSHCICFGKGSDGAA